MFQMISVLKQDDTLFLSTQTFYFCFLIQEDCVAFEISIQKFEWVIQKFVSAIQTSELAIQYQTETATHKYQTETASHAFKQTINNLNRWVVVLDVIINIQKQPPVVFYKKAVLKNFAVFTGKHLCWKGIERE